jgi:excisionase family DNA binding protein
MTGSITETRAPLKEQGEESFLTTGEASAASGLSQMTIIRSFDKGDLNGHRVPGGKHRRITRASLVAFMKRNGIPLTNLGISDEEKSFAIEATSVNVCFDCNGVQGKSSVEIPRIKELQGILQEKFGRNIQTRILIDKQRLTPVISIQSHSGSLEGILPRIENVVREFLKQ